MFLRLPWLFAPWFLDCSLKHIGFDPMSFPEPAIRRRSEISARRSSMANPLIGSNWRTFLRSTRNYNPYTGFLFHQITIIPELE